MKKVFLLTCLLGLGILAFSQKYAIIDTRYILDKMTDYKAAQAKLAVVVQLGEDGRLDAIGQAALNLGIAGCRDMRAARVVGVGGDAGASAVQTRHSAHDTRLDKLSKCLTYDEWALPPPDPTQTVKKL